MIIYGIMSFALQDCKLYKHVSHDLSMQISLILRYLHSIRNHIILNYLCHLCALYYTLNNATFYSCTIS
jgi:hypothetical protein